MAVTFGGSASFLGTEASSKAPAGREEVAEWGEGSFLDWVCNLQRLPTCKAGPEFASLVYPCNSGKLEADERILTLDD